MQKRQRETDICKCIVLVGIVLEGIVIVAIVLVGMSVIVKCNGPCLCFAVLSPSL